MIKPQRVANNLGGLTIHAEIFEFSLVNYRMILLVAGFVTKP